MSKTKRLLSVFLAVLMVLSSVTVGLTAFAADAEIKTYDGLDEDYQALATALQKSYVVDAKNYVKANTRVYVATDNESGDIKAAADAFYKIIDASNKAQRYGGAVSALETTLKNAMGKDYTTAMKTALGNICGNGSISSFTSNYVFKFTVNQNINTILTDYENAADVPDKAADKSTAYTYTQTSATNFSTEMVNGEVDMSAFKNFAAMFSADVLKSDYDKLPEGALDKIDAEGQSVIDAAKVITAENIKKFFGDDVSIDAAQAYLDGILVYKSNEYVKAVDAIKTELDGKNFDGLDMEAVTALKAKLDAANALYNSYVDVQKEHVEASYKEYTETLVPFYEDSFNYNKAPEYAEAVKAVEKYADNAYAFTKEELADVKALLDSADKKYSEFLGEPTYQNILDNKAVYDKALANYTAAYEYYDWQDYNAVVAELALSFDNETVLNVAKTAAETSSTVMTLSDDIDQSLYKAVKNFAYLVNFLYTKHADDYGSDIVKVVEKITADFAKIMGEDAVKEKDVYNILLTYFHKGPAASGAYNKYIVLERAYMFDYASLDDIPESISYESPQIYFAYDYKTFAYKSCTESTKKGTDANAYGAFNLFANTFTDDFLNRNLDECTFEQLSFIRRKAVTALNGISAYSEAEIAHIFGDAKYPQALALNAKCDELMKAMFNAELEAVLAEYDGREVTAAEAKAFFAESEKIDNLYAQLSDAVKADETVAANVEKYNALKAEIKIILDESNAKEFVDMVKDFEDKYPEKSLDMSIYDAFNADIKVVLDFYGACSE